jgi:hypothetical protein
MSGLFAIASAFLAFAVPLAVPLFVRRWQTLLVVVAVGAAFFAWLAYDLQQDGAAAAMIGSFLGGLMLIGFAFGAIAKFVMLIGRPKSSETDSSSG